MRPHLKRGFRVRSFLCIYGTVRIGIEKEIAVSLDESTLTETEKLNLPFLNLVAEDPSLHEGLPIPEEDLELFQKHMFEQDLAQRPRVLDAGCGMARYAGDLADVFAYEGVDLSEKMLECARERNPQLNFKHMSFAHSDFPDGRFHGIWCFCALNTTPKAEVPKVFKEFKRILGHRGLLFLAMPNHGYVSEGVENTQLGVPLYYSSWDPIEFAPVVLGAGFKILNLVRREEFGSFTVLAQKI